LINEGKAENQRKFDWLLKLQSCMVRAWKIEIFNCGAYFDTSDEIDINNQSMGKIGIKEKRSQSIIQRKQTKIST
jgi:hypothetical protein